MWRLQRMLQRDSERKCVLILRAIVKKCRQPQNVTANQTLVLHTTHRRFDCEDILNDEAIGEVHIDVIPVALK